MATNPLRSLQFGSDTYTVPQPVNKTSDMTQAVGVDSDGKLWTEPGGGGGGSPQFVKIYEVTLTEDTNVIVEDLPDSYDELLVIIDPTLSTTKALFKNTETGAVATNQFSAGFPPPSGLAMCPTSSNQIYFKYVIHSFTMCGNYTVETFFTNNTSIAQTVYKKIILGDDFIPHNKIYIAAQSSSKLAIPAGTKIVAYGR